MLSLQPWDPAYNWVSFKLFLLFQSYISLKIFLSTTFPSAKVWRESCNGGMPSRNNPDVHPEHRWGHHTGLTSPSLHCIDLIPICLLLHLEAGIDLETFIALHWPRLSHELSAVHVRNGNNSENYCIGGILLKDWTLKPYLPCRKSNSRLAWPASCLPSSRSRRTGGRRSCSAGTRWSRAGTGLQRV